MTSEDLIQIEEENNSNQEEEKNASSVNEPEESTERFVVEKGKGTALKDIPNVLSKLEEKAFSFFTALHCILYGFHDEVEDFKKDVLDFSGFIPHGDGENQRDKVKERLDKCTRDMLVQFCSVFEVPVANAYYAMKKKEIIELLLDFMEAPYDVTNDAKFFHSEKSSSKRKLMTTEVSLTSKRSGSTHKKISKKKNCSESDNSTSLETIHDEGNEEETLEEDEIAFGNEPEEKRCSQNEENDAISRKSTDKGVTLPKDVLDTKGSRGGASFDLNDTNSSEKRTKSVWELEKSTRKDNSTDRRVAEGDKPPNEWCDPSYEEVQKAISSILENIDISTATFLDVLEELDEHFEMDISPRKGAIKVMIEEELYRLADEAQEKESSEGHEEEEEDEKQDENEK